MTRQNRRRSRSSISSKPSVAFCSIPLIPQRHLHNFLFGSSHWYSNLEGLRKEKNEGLENLQQIKQAMFHISNCLIGILNVLTLIISFPIIGVGLWLRSNADTECERVFLWPILITGLILMVVALLGLFGACCNVSSFLWLYLCVMFFVVIGLLSFTVFAVVVTSRGVGEAVSRKGLVEDKLGDFSKWLRNRVVENETWSSIKSCMVETGVCDSFHLLDSKEVDDFYLSTLSSIKLYD
ncbi:hypothetical protein HPP92_018565 [Vanilla planifolia]|uniref:Uncharacterized protein n=1 Tax=Vanilla planifolia TaxID=51239 RepID=A0A835UPI2_VANPL|nr:hypothetical protein HPP92_018565 [Vanilla planifolia]